MQQIWSGTPRQARELVRNLLRLGVEAIATDKHDTPSGPRANVYVPIADADMVRKYLALSNDFMQQVRGTA